MGLGKLQVANHRAATWDIHEPPHISQESPESENVASRNVNDEPPKPLSELLHAMLALPPLLLLEGPARREDEQKVLAPQAHVVGFILAFSLIVALKPLALPVRGYG